MRPEDTQELAQLTDAVRAGKTEAWSKLYQMTHLPLLRLIQRLTGDPVKAEDLLHATYVTAIEHLHGYDPQKGTIDAWLVGVAKFKVLESRRKPRHASLVSEPMQGLHEGEDLDREMIALALDQLEPRHAEVLRRKYLEDQSLAEIAEALETKEATVGTWLHRARAQFRAAYELLKQRTESPPDARPDKPSPPLSKKTKPKPPKRVRSVQKDAVG